MENLSSDFKKNQGFVIIYEQDQARKKYNQLMNKINHKKLINHKSSPIVY